MFLATDHSKTVNTDYPVNCTFNESDWHILASYWHPVAFVHDIKDKPVAAKLLDVNLVIYRTAKGITVAKDLCMHRGAKLSMGWMSDDQIVCPMHGLHYDAEGTCTRIPCMGEDARIPEKLRLLKYQTKERYGIVWACLKDTSIGDVPDWPLLEDPKINNHFMPVGCWFASASRHTENFNDLAHFPWVHQGSFGGKVEHAEVPIYEVERTDYGLRFEYPYQERVRIPTSKAEGRENHSVIYIYELTLPFSTAITVNWQDSDFVHYFCDTASPVSANETKVFQVLNENTNEVPHEFWVNDTNTINSEDAPIVEGQSPEQVPLDLREEIHLPADRASMEYRRAMAELGLGAAMTA